MNFVNDSNEIRILSGEGEIGTVEVYTGKKTQRAVRARLTRESCKGDRWSRAIQYSHESDSGGYVGLDLSSNGYCDWPYIG